MMMMMTKTMMTLSLKVGSSGDTGGMGDIEATLQLDPAFVSTDGGVLSKAILNQLEQACMALDLAQKQKSPSL